MRYRSKGSCWKYKVKAWLMCFTNHPLEFNWLITSGGWKQKVLELVWCVSGQCMQTSAMLQLMGTLLWFWSTRALSRAEKICHIWPKVSYSGGKRSRWLCGNAPHDTTCWNQEGAIYYYSVYDIEIYLNLISQFEQYTINYTRNWQTPPKIIICQTQDSNNGVKTQVVRAHKLILVNRPTECNKLSPVRSLQAILQYCKHHWIWLPRKFGKPSTG